MKKFYQRLSQANKKLEEDGQPFKDYTKDEIKSTLYEWAERLVKRNCTKVSFEEVQHNAEQDRLHFLKYLTLIRQFLGPSSSAISGKEF